MSLVLGGRCGGFKRQWVWEPPTVVLPQARRELTSHIAVALLGPHCFLTQGLGHPPFGQATFHFVARVVRAPAHTR